MRAEGHRHQPGGRRPSGGRPAADAPVRRDGGQPALRGRVQPLAGIFYVFGYSTKAEREENRVDGRRDVVFGQVRFLLPCGVDAAFGSKDIKAREKRARIGFHWLLF